MNKTESAISWLIFAIGCQTFDDVLKENIEALKHLAFLIETKLQDKEND